MFDGLKEKLDRFTDEAEADVDEAAIDEDAPAETAEAVEDAPAETAEAVEDAPAETAEAQAVDDAHSDGDTLEEGGGESTDIDAEPPSRDGTPAGSDGEHLEQAVVDEEASSEADAETDDGGRGFAERAKLFATGRTVIDEDDLEAHLEGLEFALLGSDVELEVTREILDGVEENLVGETRRRLESTGNIIHDALREALYDVISVGQFDFDQRVMEAEKPVVIIFTGVNGVGKTTTIAKLAQYLEEGGLSTVLANGDTYRAGANEQLREHADTLGKKVISHQKGSDPAAVIYDAVEYADANDVDVVLGDTAGRLHTSDGLMDQLAKIDRVIEPDMTLFVDEAVAGQDAVNRASEFDDASEIDGTVLTKVDADSQGGAAISIAHVTGKPILFLGTGQGYDDIERFDPERIVNQLLGKE
jgi:fused signal recognition particle receptor